MNCSFCNQLVNPYYLKYHEKTAKCLKQTQKIETNAINGNNSNEMNENTSIDHKTFNESYLVQ